jgi:hypothetical protein
MYKWEAYWRAQTGNWVPRDVSDRIQRFTFHRTHSGDKNWLCFLILFKDQTQTIAKSFHLCPCYRGSFQIPFLLRQIASNKRWRAQDVTPRSRPLDKLTTSSHLRICSRSILVSTSYRRRLQTGLRPGVNKFSKHLEATSKTLRTTVKENLVATVTLSPRFMYAWSRPNNECTVASLICELHSLPSHCH